MKSQKAKRSFNSSKPRSKRGAALLIVLLIVMAITTLSLGFLTKSDTELTCGENMILRSEMDYLAESGLEHAKGLILTPQEVAGEYWGGAARQQIVVGSSDYYDVSVVKLSECNYQITSAAYREVSGQKVGLSTLTAELRLDPCITMRTGDGWVSESIATINGDVDCRGDLGGNADINGDAYSKNNVTASNVLGREYEAVADADAPVSFPGLQTADFSAGYYIGDTQYLVDTIDVNGLNDVTLAPSASNPAGIYYRNGDLTLMGNNNITGTLVVKDHLQVDDGTTVVIAEKNFPALIVGDKLKLGNSGRLAVEGLVQIGNEVEGLSASGAELSVTGALFIRDHSIDGLEGNGNSVVITASPDKAAIEIWSATGKVERWTPAAGAFFKSIQRL